MLAAIIHNVELDCIWPENKITAFSLHTGHFRSLQCCSNVVVSTIQSSFSSKIENSTHKFPNPRYICPDTFVHDGYVYSATISKIIVNLVIMLCNNFLTYFLKTVVMLFFFLSKAEGNLEFIVEQLFFPSTCMLRKRQRNWLTYSIVS